LRPRKKCRPLKKFLRPFVWDFLSFLVCARGKYPGYPPFYPSGVEIFCMDGIFLEGFGNFSLENP